MTGQGQPLGSAGANPAPTLQGRIDDQIDALQHLTSDELRKRWSRLFEASVPKGFSRDLLARGIAYKLQEQAYGGLSASIKRRLRTMDGHLKADKPGSFDPGPTLKPGTKLIREWQAQFYTVTVLDDGFQFEDRRYASLSMIAREITGVRWSGPRFFGLKKETSNAQA